MSAEATKNKQQPSDGPTEYYFFGTRVSESLQFVGEASLTLNYRQIFFAPGKILNLAIQPNYIMQRNQHRKPELYSTCKSVDAHQRHRFTYFTGENSGNYPVLCIELTSTVTSYMS